MSGSASSTLAAKAIVSDAVNGSLTPMVTGFRSGGLIGIADTALRSCSAERASDARSAAVPTVSERERRCSESLVCLSAPRSLTWKTAFRSTGPLPAAVVVFSSGRLI